MLEFFAGKTVSVFRLGTFDSSRGAQGSQRPRPVLVKLATPWDRKVILLLKSNLKLFL